MPRKHSPMTAKRLAGLSLYLEQRHRAFDPIDAEAADLSLLLWGLPQSAILPSTHVGRDGFSPFVNLVLRNRRPHAQRHEPHTEANPRRLDPEAFAYVSLLLLPGDTIFIDTASRKDTPEGDRLHYVEVLGRDGITLQRLVAGAAAGQAVNEAPDHHELRRGFLTLGTPAAQTAEGKRNQGSYRTRQTAIDRALLNFEVADAAGRLPTPLTASHYRALLEAFARLLDQRTLGGFVAASGR